MRKVLAGAGLCTLLLVLTSGSLFAQATASIAANGDFEQGVLNEWSLYGNNNGQALTKYNTVETATNWCNKWRPGSNRGNGGLTQEIYLIGGLTYNFGMDVAIKCSC